MKRCFCDLCKKEVERTRSGGTNIITLHMGGIDPEHDMRYDVCNSCVLRVVDTFEDIGTQVFTKRFVKEAIKRNQW